MDGDVEMGDEAVIVWWQNAMNSFVSKSIEAEKSMFFSGIQIEMTQLHSFMQRAEEEFEPALFLRQVMHTSSFSEMDMDAAKQICFRAWELSVRKKSCLTDLVADFGMLKYLIGLTIEEFSVLFLLVLPFMLDEFPLTAIRSEPNSGNTCLTLRLILFLTLQKLRHLVSLRSMQGTTGWAWSHIGDVTNRCEVCLHKALAAYLQASSLAELHYDAQLFYRTRHISGRKFYVAFLVDGTYHVICKPADDDI